MDNSPLKNGHVATASCKYKSVAVHVQSLADRSVRCVSAVCRMPGPVALIRLPHSSLLFVLCCGDTHATILFLYKMETLMPSNLIRFLRLKDQSVIVLDIKRNMNCIRMGFCAPTRGSHLRLCSPGSTARLQCPLGSVSSSS